MTYPYKQHTLNMWIGPAVLMTSIGATNLNLPDGFKHSHNIWWAAHIICILYDLQYWIALHFSVATQHSIPDGHGRGNVEICKDRAYPINSNISTVCNTYSAQNLMTLSLHTNLQPWLYWQLGQSPTRGVPGPWSSEKLSILLEHQSLDVIMADSSTCISVEQTVFNDTSIVHLTKGDSIGLTLVKEVGLYN